MPNHIKNRLKFEGEQEQITKLIESYSTFYEEEPNRAHDGTLIYKKKTGDGDMDYTVGWLDEETNIFSRRDGEDVGGVPEGFELDMNEAWTWFPDFNKIVPMPESLNIEHSSLGTMAQTLLFGTGGDAWLGIEELQKRMRDRGESEKRQAVELALKYQSNLEEHGHITWYEWAVEHWGTKWNSYSCEQKDGIYLFETAWSGVLELVEKMSKAHPEVTIHYSWADEDTGNNCGSAVLLNGIISVDEPEGGSKEAYELAFDLRPDRREWYELVDGEYQYKEEEDTS